jgi:hypothetical protein
MAGKKFLEVSEMDKVLHVIVVAIGFVIWRASGNIIIAAIAAVALEGIIQMIGGAMRQKKVQKQLEGITCPDVYYAGGNLNDQKDQKETKGLRVLILLPENAGINTDLLKAVYQEGLEAYYKSDTMFRAFYSLFAAENLPIGIYATKCLGENELLVTKASASWREFLEKSLFESDSTQEPFIYEYTFSPQGGGESLKCGLGFIFDKSLGNKKTGLNRRKLFPASILNF